MTFLSHKNIFGFVTICVFMSVAVFGFFMVSDHHHESICPFMVGEQSMCPMGLLDHIKALQDVFTVPVPCLLFIIIILGTVVLLWKFSHPPNLLGWSNQNFETFDYSFLYQKLFSQGILNPKAP